MKVIADTFVLVAADCPATRSVVPTARGGRKTVPVLQYELLTEHPYRYGHEDLIYEVHVRHKGISSAELAARGESLRSELFRKPHPCMRASALPKLYGWGVHYDAEGRIALYAMESEEYRRFTAEVSGGPKVVPAMRSKRA